MSTKQCEEKLKDKGVRPTAARILILQKLSEQTYPISLLELEAQLETLDKSTISRSLAILLEHHAVHAFEDGSGSMKYEICRSDTDTCFIENRHIHFYCEVCHKTYCMDPIKSRSYSCRSFIMDTINYTVKGIVRHASQRICKMQSSCKSIFGSLHRNNKNRLIYGSKNYLPLRMRMWTRTQ